MEILVALCVSYQNCRFYRCRSNVLNVDDLLAKKHNDMFINIMPFQIYEELF